MNVRSCIPVAGAALLALCGTLPGRAQTPRAQTPTADRPPLVALTVGGGPSPRMNQVAIESNVRYVHSLLPLGTRETVLFADGKSDTESVLYLDPPATPAPAERAFRFLAGDPLVVQAERRRAPRLPVLSGPARQQSVADALAGLRSAPANTPVLLYFTGHGSPPRNGDFDNNRFDLWGGEVLSVREAAPLIAPLLAKNRPVVLVMVQCYSGAFGNLLFENGDPKGELLANADLCGFFATVKERPAAGCTPEVNEAEYRDFTSSFFAALSGRDRLGRAVPTEQADYDKNGRVGMNEAFAYAQINEPSIDIPVATSDVFLRRFVEINDRDLLATPYAQIRAAATPAQRAVLDALSTSLALTTEDRFRLAFTTMGARLDREQDEERGITTGGDPLRAGRLYRLAALRKRERDALAERIPEVTNTRPTSPAWRDVRARAVKHLETLPPERLAALNAAADEVLRDQEASLASQVMTARWARFVRLAKSVVLTRRLRATGRPDLIARFDRLLAAEARNPLRPGGN